MESYIIKSNIKYHQNDVISINMKRDKNITNSMRKSTFSGQTTFYLHEKPKYILNPSKNGKFEITMKIKPDAFTFLYFV